MNLGSMPREGDTSGVFMHYTHSPQPRTAAMVSVHVNTHLPARSITHQDAACTVSEEKVRIFFYLLRMMPKVLTLLRSCIHLAFSCTLIDTGSKHRVGACDVDSVQDGVAPSRMSGRSFRTRSRPDPRSPFIRQTKPTPPLFAATSSHSAAA